MLLALFPISIRLSAQTTDPATLSGVVLNATTGLPVARALVKVGSHALLTEDDGKFEFTGASGSTATLQVRKPGFYDGLDPNPSGKSVTFSSSGAGPVKVYLYPESLITGTLISVDGDPLPGVMVQAFRKGGASEDGGSNLVSAGTTRSNADGAFRLPLPPGDYVLETQFVANEQFLQKAVLPMMVPDGGASSEPGTRSSLHLTSGVEQHLDLRPQLRSSHEVHIRIEGASEGSPQGFAQIEEHLGNGLSFNAPVRPGGAPGEMVATLPSGHYTLSATTTDRDAASYGEANIDVPNGSSDKEGSVVALHLTRASSLSIELAVDPAASTSTSSTSDNQSTPPTVQQLGLRFAKMGTTTDRSNHDGYVRMGRDQVPSITLLPGRYRLVQQSPGPWFVESATMGGTDLMTQELDVDSGSAATTLRLTVNNQTGNLKGTVKLAGEPARCWVYLLANSRSITPAILSVSGADGTVSRSIPPGDYRAVAFEAHPSVDLSDAATLERLGSYIKSFSVAAGETANLDIDAIPTLELLH